MVISEALFSIYGIGRRPVGKTKQPLATFFLRSHPRRLLKQESFQEMLQHKAEELYSFAENQVRQRTEAHSDLNIFQKISEQAVRLSNNRPPVYLALMNEVFLGSQPDKVLDRFYGLGRIPKRLLDNKPAIFIGDTGLHERYRDYTLNQLSGHFWPFVNYGFHVTPSPLLSELIAWGGNIVHEVLHQGRSRQDYELSLLATVIGAEFRSVRLTPEEFTKNMQTILGTDQYKQVHSRFSVISRLFPVVKPGEGQMF